MIKQRQQPRHFALPPPALSTVHRMSTDACYPNFPLALLIPSPSPALQEVKHCTFRKCPAPPVQSSAGITRYRQSAGQGVTGMRSSDFHNTVSVPADLLCVLT
ncbi:hypothetical protein AOLI_G00013770 [Acnodon oligacanthus]